MSAKAGVFETTTAAAGNTIAITGVGFQPELVIFLGHGHTGTGMAGSHRGNSIGWAISSTDRRAVGRGRVDNQDGGATRRGHSDAACITILKHTETDGALDLVSMDADGFTVIIDNAFSSSYKIGYLAIKGLDNQKSGTLTEPGSTGNVSYSGIGFRPSALIFISSCDATAAPVDVSGGHYMVGFTDGSNESVCNVFAKSGGTSSQAKGYGYNGECIAMNTDHATTQSLSGRAEIVSLDVDGFTLNWLERNASRIVHYLALQGDEIATGDFLTLTSTGNFSVTGVGFQADGILFGSHCNPVNAQDVVNNTGNTSYAVVTSSTNRFSFSDVDVHNLSVAPRHHLKHNTDAMYVNINDSSSPAVDGQADFVSMDADGFTLNMGNADPTASMVQYIAFREAAGGTFTPRINFLFSLSGLSIPAATAAALWRDGVAL